MSRYADVLDARGNKLSPCPEDRARDLIRRGKAEIVSEEPFIIRLHQVVDIPRPATPEPARPPEDRRLLLHICCAPCSTYSVRHLTEQGGAIVGFWFNPNIHPEAEHERRRETLARYAGEAGFDVIWEPGFEMDEFLQAVAGREAFRVRCMVCYRMRLECTARVAAREGFDAFSSTLLISPYQDQEAIRSLGEEVAATHGVEFYFENLRKGFAEHYRLARASRLYMQNYCGCIYSLREAEQQRSSRRPTG
ncbi:MAG TPA: hypothetical protein GX702_14310 [Chloroflexi bacterium]|jgi:predicted adenine nucleotide alpha hydrolase (AANH) superfamily ATPase|nr:hypothetical protein [Chloroflexota bacterium]